MPHLESVRLEGNRPEKRYARGAHIRDRTCVGIHIVSPEIGIVGPGDDIDGAVRSHVYAGHGRRLSRSIPEVKTGGTDIHIVQVDQAAVAPSAAPIPERTDGTHIVPFEFAPQIAIFRRIRTLEVSRYPLPPIDAT